MEKWIGREQVEALIALAGCGGAFRGGQKCCTQYNPRPVAQKATNESRA